MPDDWFSASTQPQASPQPRVRPVFTAPPKAPDPIEMRREQRAEEDQAFQRQKFGLDIQKDQRDATKDALDQQEALDKRNRAAKAKLSAAEKLRNVITLIDEIKDDASDNGGFGETGLSGSMLGGISGTAAYDLRGNVKTIDANSAFSALQEMRDNSPTGGALGQVTEKELDLLKSSIANLDPNQSQEQFLANLDRAKGVYERMLGQIEPVPPGYQEELDQWLGTQKPGSTDKQDYEAFRLNLDRQFGRSPAPPGYYANDGFIDSFNVRGMGAKTQIPQDVQGNPLWDEFLSGVGDVVETGGDVLGLVANPANAAVNTAFGTSLTTDLGKTLRDATGLPDISDPYAKALTQGALSGMAGAGLARGVASIATNPVTQAVASRVAARPGLDTVAGATSGLSSETARQSGAGPIGQFAAGLAGGLAGVGGMNALARVGGTSAPNALAQTAQRQGVDLLPADAGGSMVRRVSGAAAQAPLSASPIISAANRSQSQMGNALSRAAANEGEIATTDVAGEALRAAGKAYAARTGKQGAALYDRAQEAAKGVKIKPVTATQVIDDQIARLGELSGTNGPLIQSLQTLKDDIANGVSVTGLRDARTALSQGTFDGKLRSGQEKAIYKQVIAALSNDVENGLRSVGRERAAAMFQTADAFWKGRVEQIDEVLEPIIGGKKGGEEIVAAVEKMARGQSGGNKRLNRLLSELEPNEAGSVRAVVADRLGKANPGAQNPEGTAFSASTFLANWAKMTPQAKVSLFGNGELRKALDDIAVLSDSTKQAQKFANTSNTAGALVGNVGVGTAGMMADPFLGSVALGSQYMTGRLMASPAFARWLARAPKNPQANTRHIDELGKIAAREPLIAGDAKALQSFLTEAIAQSPTRAAAGQNESDRR